MNKTRYICINGLGIGLFVALTLCLQVPLFENYYFCLGYFIMIAYLYIVGTSSGILVGAFGVILYCIITGELRGLPGWALGNVIIGIMLGITFKFIKKLDKPFMQIGIASCSAVFSVALGILVVKSAVECVIYSLPFLARVAMNIYAFVADLAIIIISIPVSIMLSTKLKNCFK